MAMALVKKAEKASVTYRRLANIHVDGKNHTYTVVKVSRLNDREPEVAIDHRELGMGSLKVVVPSPLGLCFGVCWNGSIESPSLRFDNYPEGDFEVLVEAWGA